MIKVIDGYKPESRIIALDEKFHRTCPESNMDNVMPTVKGEDSESFYNWNEFIDENK